MTAFSVRFNISPMSAVTTQSDILQKLKVFHAAGKGPWSNIADDNWKSWQWQLKSRLTSLEQLQEQIPNLTEAEIEGAQLANTKLAMAITPYFLNLIDGNDRNCPIRLQMLPRIEETHTAPWEMSDPCGEDAHSPVPGLVHRYPDRVLFLVTDRCAAYCRYCTRSRLVSNATGYDFRPNFEQTLFGELFASSRRTLRGFASVRGR